MPTYGFGPVWNGRSIQVGVCSGILLKHLIDKYDEHVNDATTSVVGTVHIEPELFEGCQHDSEKMDKIMEETKSRFQKRYPEWKIVDFSYSINTNIVFLFKWKRDEKKKMTIAEIEKLLGYGIEVISGE